MKQIENQIRDGQLVCPMTHQCLRPNADFSTLITEDGSRSYPVIDHVPFLFANNNFILTNENGMAVMGDEYTRLSDKRGQLIRYIKKWLAHDYRSRDSQHALNNFIDAIGSSALILSIGGGPGRPHPSFCNINLSAYPNVDVACDAHLLPYADASVDGIFCEAVLEHLRKPEVAVSEMNRVLRSGCKVISITPFLQPFHGYPDHYRNYTLSGHRALFLEAGFEVEDSGTCVGPIYAILDIMQAFLAQQMPGILSWPLRKIWRLIAAPLHPLDRLFNSKRNSHILASTTFVLARRKDA